MSLLFEWDDRGTRRVILFDDFHWHGGCPVWQLQDCQVSL